MRLADKYRAMRSVIPDGAIVLCESNKAIAQAIQHVDDCQYHHSGVAFWSNARLFIMDAHPGKGTSPAYFSRRMETQNWTNFLILEPTISQMRIKMAMQNAFLSAELYKPYDLAEVFKIALYQYTGHWSESNPDKWICSEFTQYYGIELGITQWRPENLQRPFFTPQDHLRLFDADKLRILES